VRVQGKLTIERMCQVACVSRAGFYRHWQEEKPVEAEMEVRSAIQQIALEHRRRYGYRRVGEELKRRGLCVNHKRVLRLMREDNLLGVQARRFVRTTVVRPEEEVFLNLARQLELTGINQLWVADITYIRLQTEFVYLAVIIDAFSRKVVGRALERSLKSELTLLALERAIAERQPPAGLVHHSDRGWQYACADYLAVLRQHHIVASMSRAGNPYDNALCESWIKTLKQEEIYVSDYRDLEHMDANLEIFIEQYYNRRRLHSALNYRSPEEFERFQQEQAGVEGALPGVAKLRFSVPPGRDKAGAGGVG
jgi:putative transposase